MAVPRSKESHLPPMVTVLVAIVLQLLLPDRLAAGPRWLLPIPETLMLAGLVFATPQRLTGPHALRRRLSLGVTALTSIGNGIALILLCHLLFQHQLVGGQRLIVSGALIWVTNVLIFALWYWELDAGGPGRRAARQADLPDFLFPLTNMPDIRPGWRPFFLDYLYTSLTNATAFSPTDTMPLSITAKMMMAAQSLMSLVTIGLVIARAVNIL